MTGSGKKWNLNDNMNKITFRKKNKFKNVKKV